jgi:phage I-like protein
MSKPHSTHFSTIELASEKGGAPEWVALTPPGPELAATDGRRHRLSDPESVVAEFKSRGVIIPIDVEHATEVRAPRGEAAPAYGWVRDMEVRDRAIWARVDWTAQGAEWVASGAYKFLSIGYFVDKASGEIKRIKSAGLTNTPGFRMPELARADNDKETDMDKDVLEALGLKPDATTADAVAKITDLKSTVETARAGPDRDKYVPRAQHEAALARIDKFEQADTARATQELTGLVEEGIEAGKIAPAAKDDFIEMARAQGTEKFRATLDKMPRVVGGTEEMDEKARADTAAGKSGLSAEDIAVAHALGVPEAEFAKAKQEQEA